MGSFDISVILPLAGTFDWRRAEMSVASVASQEECKVEVVVVTDHQNQDFGKDLPCKRVVRCSEKSVGAAFNLGGLRNAGACLSSASTLYFSDADILLHERTFLKRCLALLDQGTRQAYFRPNMHRLPLPEFQYAYTQFQKLGIVNMTKLLVSCDDFFATISGNSYQYEVFSKQDNAEGYFRIFTALADDFQLYQRAKEREPAVNRWSCFWLENRHCGGFLVDQRSFLEVGGYGEHFINWGCDDTYFRWKLESVAKLSLFPSGFAVTHLDHERVHVNPNDWISNEAQFSELRMHQGLESCIKKDRARLARYAASRIS